MYWDPVVQSDVAYLTWPIVETSALPLEVLPLPVLPVPLVVPAGSDRFASGPGLLAREQEWQPPSLVMLALLILFPPLLCIILYAIWKRCYPDAVTASRRRQTRAARLALRELAAGRQLPPEQQAERAAAAVARYLQARLDVTLVEPTPTEATRFLGQAGLQGSAVQQTVAFLRACDAARFGGVSSARLPDDGSAVVLLLEAQKWASFLLLSVALTLGVDTDEPLAELPETDLAARASTEVAAGLGERDNEVEARPHFRRAVRYYEELQRRGVHNAVLFRNLGNAHFLSANIPEAMLAYRRGLRLRPGDEDLRSLLPRPANVSITRRMAPWAGRRRSPSSWLLAIPPPGWSAWPRPCTCAPAWPRRVGG